MSRLNKESQFKLNQAQAVFGRLVAIHNIKIASAILKVNGRLRNKAGYTKAKYSKSTGDVCVLEVHLAKFLLEQYSLDGVLETVRHEAAHCLAFNRKGLEANNHGEHFIKAAYEMGCVSANKRLQVK